MELFPQNENQDWRLQAKCTNPEVYPQVDVGDVHHPAGEIWHDLFYPPRGDGIYKPMADAAKGMCYGRDGFSPCPVRDECLIQAIKADEVHGILGGKSHRERNAVVRRWQTRYPDLSLEEYVKSDKCK